MMLAKSLQSAAGNAAGEANYIEDVFSTWLYTGNGSTQTINNGIDLAGEGGMVWTKSRSLGTTTGSHTIYDTERGFISPSNAYFLETVNTDAQGTNGSTLTSFNSDGFSLGTAQNSNYSGSLQASWTFRKSPKFFDVVTYTGDGVANRQVTHSLGSAPGTIIVKCTNTTSDWWVWHRGDGTTARYLRLNTTAAGTTGWSMQPVSGNEVTAFEIRGGTSNPNVLNNTYVAYLFAHNAGGFGLSGEDNVISCGSFTTDGSGAATVNLGYEPQYFLFKRTDSTSNWRVLDVMRGGSLTQSSPLIPNTADVENSFGSFWSPTATGFNIINQAASSTWIYIAIRRGPMKVPESGTEVFAPLLANTSAPTFRGSFPIDLIIDMQRLGGAHYAVDRLRGSGKLLGTTSTAAEATNANYKLDYQTSAFSFASDPTYSVGQVFRRAPGFFDEVCYTGTGVARTVAHNLGVAPELMLIKRRDGVVNWSVGGTVFSDPTTNYLILNLTNAVASSSVWNNTAPTSTVFSLGTATGSNASGAAYVWYGFASCPGVSKVTNFTGNGTSQTINCGFTSGARFVMIKATSTTGNWTVFDSARGISAGGDPALYLNSTAAEVTGVDAIDADSTGFIVNQEGTFNLNASGVQYLVLAIS